MSASVGTAALQIIPSFKGFGSKLEAEATKGMTTAGNKAGEEFGDAAAKKGGDGFSSKIGSSIKGSLVAGAGLAAGVAFGGAMASALEQGALQDKLAAQLGVGAEKSKQLGEVAGNLYTNAFGDSMEGVNDAIRQVVTNIDGMRNASKGKLEDITGAVLNLNAAFDEEPAAITRAAAQMQRTGLADSTKDALDIITAGFQSGADKAQDLLDTYNEYGTQFRKLGIDGATATGLISQGLKAGARDADIVADTFKEFSIRAVDGSDQTQTAFESLGLSAQDMQEKIGAGGKSAAAATELVLDTIRAIKDPAQRSQAAVALFGTQAEDMGDALFALDLPKASRQMDDVAGAADRMGNTLSDNASSKVTAFTRKIKQGVVDFLANDVIPAIEDFADGPEGKKLGAFFSDAADDIGPLAHDLLPATVDVLGTMRDILSEAAPLAKGLADGFSKMPKWAQTALVGGGMAAFAGSKLGVGSLLTGGKGGGGGGVLGMFTKAAPLPVIVVNDLEGFDKGAASKGFSKAPWAVTLGLAAVPALGGAAAAGVTPTGDRNQMAPGSGGFAGDGGLSLPSGAIDFGFDQSLADALTGSLTHAGEALSMGADNAAEFDIALQNLAKTQGPEKAAAAFSEYADQVGFTQEALAKAVPGFVEMMTQTEKLTPRMADASAQTKRFSVNLDGLPRKLVTEFNAPGLIKSREDAVALAKQYNLTPKQKQTFFDALGIPQAKGQTVGLLEMYNRARGPIVGTVSVNTSAAEAALNRVLNLMNAVNRRGNVPSAPGVLPGEGSPRPTGRTPVGGGGNGRRGTQINIHLDGNRIASVVDDRIGTYEDLADERRRAGGPR